MTLQELENTISKLPPHQLAAFREWFHQFENDAWDKQIEADVRSGRLDKLAEEAIDEDIANRTTEL
ncbi:MAG: hypothetical protein HON04_11490 [Planctomicrobium sp.]|jgi:hypothetical protein|nr:hypothetical protein [Planctomicrobium sp.]